MMRCDRGSEYEARKECYELLRPTCGMPRTASFILRSHTEATFSHKALGGPHLSGLFLCSRHRAAGVPVFPLVFRVPKRAVEHRRDPLFQPGTVVLLRRESVESSLILA